MREGQGWGRNGAGMVRIGGRETLRPEDRSEVRFNGNRDGKGFGAETSVRMPGFAAGGEGAPDRLHELPAERAIL